MSSDTTTARLLATLDVITPPSGWVDRAVTRYERTHAMDTNTDIVNPSHAVQSTEAASIAPVWTLLSQVTRDVEVHWTARVDREWTRYRAVFRPVGMHDDRIVVEVETAPGVWYEAPLTTRGLSAIGKVVRA